MGGDVGDAVLVSCGSLREEGEGEGGDDGFCKGFGVEGGGSGGLGMRWGGDGDRASDGLCFLVKVDVVVVLCHCRGRHGERDDEGL